MSLGIIKNTELAKKPARLYILLILKDNIYRINHELEHHSTYYCSADNKNTIDKLETGLYNTGKFQPIANEISTNWIQFKYE